MQSREEPPNFSVLGIILNLQSQGAKLFRALSDPIIHKPPSPHLPTFPHCPLTSFGTVTVPALSLWGAGEVVTLDSPTHAGTALGAVTGDPGLACLQKPWEAKGSEVREGVRGITSPPVGPPYPSTGCTSTELARRRRRLLEKDLCVGKGAYQLMVSNPQSHNSPA